MLLLVVIGLVGGIIFAKKIIDNTPDVSAEDIQPKGFTTTIVDQNGTVIDTLKDSDSNRVYRTYDEITAKTDFLPHAFVPGAQKNRICRAGRPCFFENFRLS